MKTVQSRVMRDAKHNEGQTEYNKIELNKIKYKNALESCKKII